MGTPAGRTTARLVDESFRLLGVCGSDEELNREDPALSKRRTWAGSLNPCSFGECALGEREPRPVGLRAVVTTVDFMRLNLSTCRGLWLRG